MNFRIRLSCAAPSCKVFFGLLAKGAAVTPALGRAPAPAAEPLVADWVWVAALVVAIIGALWYLLRKRRG